MAKVWFVRRLGVQWVAPGGNPAFELPLEELVFKLDLGPQRRLRDLRPEPRPDLPVDPPEHLERVLVETTDDDLGALQWTAFGVGVYDSPYSPAAVAQRLARHAARAA
jgi:hypothetical protein